MKIIRKILWYWKRFWGTRYIIETVKVNGEALTPNANKVVDIDISGKVDKADHLDNGTNQLYFTIE